MNNLKFSAVALVATLSAGILQAQDLVIEEILVTAQKRTQSTLDVPIAINAFSESDIEARGISDIADLAIYTPSLNYGEAIGAAQLSIRGVGFGINSGSGENSVAAHTDGLYIANPGAVTMLQSRAAAVEVLRGPQGTLWGRNATAGAVNFITEAPSSNFGGTVEVGAGSFDTTSGYVSVHAPLSESFRTRFSVDYEDRGGVFENPNTDTGGRELADLRFSVDVDLGESVTAKLRAFDISMDSVGPVWDHPDDRALDNVFLPAFGIDFTDTYDTDPFVSLANKIPDQDDALSGGSLRFDWTVSDEITLASITGYIDFERTVNDIDYDGASIEYVTVNRDLDDSSLSQEFNLSGTHENVDWLVGAFYLDQKIGVDTLGDVSGAFPIVPLDPGMTQWLGGAFIDIVFDEDVESTALFADATFSLSDSVRVFGGVRYMEEERDSVLNFVQILSIYDSPTLDNLLVDNVLPACVDQQQTFEDDATTGRLGVQFDASDATMVYAQYSTGYKSGGNATSGCADDFDSEELNAVEIGMKSMLLNDRLRLNASAFAYDYTDLQVEEFIQSNARVNNADAEILGAEIDLRYLVTDYFELDAGLSLLDTEYTDFQNADAINDASGDVLDLAGNPLLRAPEWRMTLGGELSWAIDSGAQVHLRADVLASDSYQLREFNNPFDEQDAYTSLNARLTYLSASSDWKLILWGKNITDEEVMYSLANFNSTSGLNPLLGTPEPLNTGFAGAVYALPATYGLTFEYSFEK